TTGVLLALVARENLLSKIAKPIMHRRVGQSLHDRGVELGDYRRRRVLGSEKVLASFPRKNLAGQPRPQSGCRALPRGGAWAATQGQQAKSLDQVIDGEGPAGRRPRDDFIAGALCPGHHGTAP